MERQTKYIDIHLHPHGRSFNFLRNSKLKDSEDYHPWTAIRSNIKAMEDGRRAFSYSQCSLAQCWNGDCAVVFAAIYPFEKGFFSGGGKLDKDAVLFLVKSFSRIPLLGSLVNPILEKLAGIVFNSDAERKSAKDYFQSLLMRMPGPRVEFLQSKSYDYWTEMKEEICFLTSRSGLETESKVLKKSLKKEVKKTEEFERARGTYIVAKNYGELKDALDKKQLVIVLTIEGAHSFSTDTQLTSVLCRIKELKDKYPVFFITFSHHFNNSLCGHAHSLIKGATLFANQKDGMQAQFNPLGIAAVRLLLSLTDQNIKNETALGRRILIDVKHMGVESREQFYKEIILPALNNHGDKIPVIASHVCYSGIATFLDMKKNWQENLESDDLLFGNGLNHWNINVCDEDVEIILKTEGLLGICLDQRIMGFFKGDNRDGKKLLESNLGRLLDAVIQNNKLNQEEKSKVWKILCIGTDFEGYVDPTKNYPTVLQFEQLEEDLFKFIQKYIDEGKAEQYYISKPATEIARDICMNNVMEFLKIHFR